MVENRALCYIQSVHEDSGSSTVLAHHWLGVTLPSYQLLQCLHNASLHPYSPFPCDARLTSAKTKPSGPLNGETFEVDINFTFYKNLPLRIFVKYQFGKKNINFPLEDNYDLVK